MIGKSLLCLVMLASLAAPASAQMGTTGAGEGGFGGSGGGTVPLAVDATGTELTAFPGATSVAYTGLTVGSGLTNSALLAIVCADNQSVAPTITMTWNGTNVPLISGTSSASTGASIYCQLFGLANPAAGNQTLAVSFGGVAYSYSIVALSFKGVNQSTPFINGTTATGTSGTPSISPTVASGDIGVGAFGATVSYSSVGNTVIFTDATSSYPVAAANRAVGPNPALSAVISSSSAWIASAVAVKSN